MLPKTKEEVKSKTLQEREMDSAVVTLVFELVAEWLLSKSD